jgi:hypothetical protein
VTGDEINMNNTKTLAAIAAILIAGTLVVAGTLAATTATSAFASIQKKRGQENSKDGNTVTIQKCKQDGSVSGFDNTAEQECQNAICTHPSAGATCVSEGSEVTPPTPPTPPNPIPDKCPKGTLYDVALDAKLGEFAAGTILCLPKKLGAQDATVLIDGTTTIGVVVAQPNATPCNTDGSNAGFVHATVASGDPGNPIGVDGTVCVKLG